jgi:hypothetical protein
MKRFWGGFRQARDLREREEREKLKEEFLKEVIFLIATFGHEGEDIFRKFDKDTFPEKGDAEIEEDVKQYHAAVDERRSIDATWR